MFNIRLYRLSLSLFLYIHLDTHICVIFIDDLCFLQTISYQKEQHRPGERSPQCGLYPWREQTVRWHVHVIFWASRMTSSTWKRWSYVHRLPSQLLYFICYSSEQTIEQTVVVGELGHPDAHLTSLQWTTETPELAQLKKPKQNKLCRLAAVAGSIIVATCHPRHVTATPLNVDPDIGVAVRNSTELNGLILLYHAVIENLLHWASLTLSIILLTFFLFISV